jgi:hypothetical protein
MSRMRLALLCQGAQLVRCVAERPGKLLRAIDEHGLNDARIIRWKSPDFSCTSWAEVQYLVCGSRLWVIGGRDALSLRCLLYPREQTLIGSSSMSAKCQ